MAADFWASYLAGSIGIAVGNPLDIVKVRLQAGPRIDLSPPSDLLSPTQQVTKFFRGAAAPIIGYGALNSILFVTFNRTLHLLDPSVFDYGKLAGVDLSKIWMAGAIGGLASWVVSAPSELVKCRAQLYVDGQGSSWTTFVDVARTQGLRGLYLGGVVTSLRDSIGYGWYFWSYELTKRLLLSRQPDPFLPASTWEILFAGGIAGVITWASIYPLDVIKTRMQTRSGPHPENHHLLQPVQAGGSFRPGARQIARNIYRTEGLAGFYSGLGVCSLRAFIVNAVQWYIYERTMALISAKRPSWS